MNVEIVLDQNDCLGVPGEVEIGQIFQDVKQTRRCAATVTLQMGRQSFERRKHHEEVGGPVALGLIETAGVPFTEIGHRFGNELL